MQKGITACDLPPPPHACWLMISRRFIGVSVAVLGVALCAPSAPAQGRRGMHASAAPTRARSSIRLSGRDGFGRLNQRPFPNESAFLFPAYFYPDDDFDYGSVEPGAPPVQVIVSQPAQLPAPAASL